MAKLKVPCDNCGVKHYAPYFPHPFDEANIKKANAERATCRGGGGRGGGRGGRRKSDRKKWININDNTVGDRNYYVNGVQKMGNAWMCYF